LSKGTLGYRRGSRLFQGVAHFFYDFSPTQRAWLRYLVSLITSEMSRRDRLQVARSVSLRSTHATTDLAVSACRLADRTNLKEPHPRRTDTSPPFLTPTSAR
jgi:hypothetical protein